MIKAYKKIKHCSFIKIITVENRLRIHLSIYHSNVLPIELENPQKASKRD